MSAEDRAEVERQVAALRESLKGSDIAAVRSGMDALTGTLSRVATAAYQAASPMDGPGMPGSDGTGGDGTGGDAGASGDGSPEEGQAAGAGARSGGSNAADDAVEGEFKEV